ncbi:hypothetical protein AO385_1551 [Moraxella catarrhalis]|uniref:Uncharacterized protein n=1 Tax=Moraxella catarrhalis TaxID=480 RepID=A0A198UE14_MORCA|nr:hypothetical protein AO383_2265 [Moraxella catarrhalis]OAU94673.1 hypothetical protein AO384_2030 [Moraxella catarrhalis]OAU98668.1 hypothetical protein AO385_1551 [Moraxella catarrhalis]
MGNKCLSNENFAKQKLLNLCHESVMNQSLICHACLLR